jgi:hypothetical protein
MRNVTPPKWRRKGSLDVLAKRRREIVLHAKYVGAASTADFDVWLTQWVIHNPTAKDEVWAVMMAARRMGGEITEAEAATICDEAALCPHIPTAAQLGKTLRLTLDARTKLKISTIRPHNMSKADLDEIRRCKALVRKRELRRARGAQSREEYLAANSLSATKPWKKEGMSRAKWYKNRQRTERETSPSAPSLLVSEDRPVSTERQGLSERGFASKEERGLASSQTASTLVADIYVRVPNWCFGRKPTAELSVAA